MERTPGCLAKLDRIKKTLAHHESDRVPVSDFFWGAFLERWRNETGVAKDTNIYRYYDLDWQVTTPNMDPWIRPFQVVEQNEREVIVRTGFGALIRKRLDLPMPAFLGFDTDRIDKLLSLEFDDPWDDRRFHSRGDNQIAGVGDSFTRDVPPWTQTVGEIWPEFPVFGSVCEAHEMLWRIIGSENVMLWMGEHPEEIGRTVEKINQFALELIKAQVAAAGGKLDGMVIWGDVAYCKGMLFSPPTGASGSSQACRSLSRPATTAVCRSSTTAAAMWAASSKTSSMSESTPTIRWRPRQAWT